MRKSDKKLNIKRVNLLQEQKYLETKGVIVERLSGDLKRRAFDAGVNKYDELPSDATLHKDKLVGQTDTFASHINPEINTLVNSIGDKFGFNSSIDKTVINSADGVIGVYVYFSKFNKPSSFRFDFKLTVFKDSYEFERGTNGVEKPKDLNYMLIRLIDKIQEAEF